MWSSEWGEKITNAVFANGTHQRKRIWRKKSILIYVLPSLACSTSVWVCEMRECFMHRPTHSHTHNEMVALRWQWCGCFVILDECQRCRKRFYNMSLPFFCAILLIWCNYTWAIRLHYTSKGTFLLLRSIACLKEQGHFNTYLRATVWRRRPKCTHAHTHACCLLLEIPMRK